MKKGFTTAVLLAALLWVPCNSALAANYPMLPQDVTPADFPPNNTYEYFPIALNGFSGFQWVLAISNLTTINNLTVTVDSIFFSGGSIGGSVQVLLPALGSVFVTPPAPGVGLSVPCPSPGCQVIAHRAPNNNVLFFAELITFNPDTGAFNIQAPFFFTTP
ncbi:MAG: hypothetical protein KGL31_13220 [candidate division NC10 bacterium]|nr:hypothetical protein [candidate division NC10 bacterium]